MNHYYIPVYISNIVVFPSNVFTIQSDFETNEYFFFQQNFETIYNFKYNIPYNKQIPFVANPLIATISPIKLKLKSSSLQNPFLVKYFNSQKKYTTNTEIKIRQKKRILPWPKRYPIKAETDIVVKVVRH